MNEYEVLVPILAILVGGTAVLVPIVGITARFALKPVIDTYLRARESVGSEQRLALTEQRLALVEEQLHMLEREQERLAAESEFQRQLGAPRS